MKKSAVMGISTSVVVSYSLIVLNVSIACFVFFFPLFLRFSDLLPALLCLKEDLDPVFADDPLSQVDLLPILRGVLVSLWNSNQKFFEVMIGQCDADDRLCFVKIWQKQLQAHQQQKK